MTGPDEFTRLMAAELVREIHRTEGMARLQAVQRLKALVREAQDGDLRIIGQEGG